MKCCVTSICVLLVSGLGGVSGKSVTPLQKVIELLNGMVSKGHEEREKEQVIYSRFSQWCVESTSEKKRLISKAAENINKLAADVSLADQNIADATIHIAQLVKGIATNERELQEAAAMRETEQADYTKSHQDYEESIDALQRAIAILQQQPRKLSQVSGEALAQVSSLKLVPESAKTSINSFLEQSDSTAELPSAPVANAYEFHSESIVQLLNKLLDKFKSEIFELENAEKSAVQNFRLNTADLTATNVQLADDRDFQTNRKADNEAEKLEKEQVKRETEESKAADEQYLQSLTELCQTKSSEFQARQKLRVEELDVLAKAILLLQNGVVPHEEETFRAGSLAQLRASYTQPETLHSFLVSEASRVHSPLLSMLASRAASDPFVKVRVLIKELLVRLKEESAAEAEHKGWCDSELQTNNQTRTEKSQNVFALHAQIDVLQARIQKLTQEISDLDEDIQAIDDQVANATASRVAEAADNAETIADAKSAQVALNDAITLLTEFYKKSGQATAFSQQDPESDAPVTWHSEYKGLQAENGGVLGYLEVIQSDYARLEAETTSAEEGAVKMFNDFKVESAQNRARKQQGIDDKTTKKSTASNTLAEKSNMLEDTQKELDAAVAYYDKLKPSCVDASVAPEKRVASREEEIQSLQEALRILNSET